MLLFFDMVKGVHSGSLSVSTSGRSFGFCLFVPIAFFARTETEGVKRWLQNLAVAYRHHGKRISIGYARNLLLRNTFAALRLSGMEYELRTKGDEQ